tara:strand:+ start:1891 stop:3048 length:1158 start_codon:yes stop_codon:yes gene_type:complete
MNSWTYHSVIPENNKSGTGATDGYTEFDNVDFNLEFEGRALNLNSVRLIGSVKVTDNGTSLANPANIHKDIKLDRLVGAHSFIESIQTSFFNGSSLVENLSDYPRYVKMKNAGRKGINQMNNGSNVCELLAPVDDMTNLILKGTTPPDNSGANLDPLDPDFSIRPEFCLNNATGNPVLPYSKTNSIRVTVNLNRVFSALYGLDVSSTTKYRIQNLKLSFTSVPESPEMIDEKSVMRTIYNLKQSVESSFANIGVKVPEICDRVSCSFQLQSAENTAKNNNTELAKVVGLQEVQFLMNDSTNSLISFLLRDYEEVISRYIGSFYDTGKNALTANQLANNDGFGIGLDFDSFIDLRNNRFTLQLSSAINQEADHLIIYMYFHSVMTV